MKDYHAEEIPSDKEVKTAEELAVELPKGNDSFSTLALAPSKPLPRQPELPSEKAAVATWQQQRRTRLGEIVREKQYRVGAVKKSSEEKDGLKITFWQLKMDDAWTVPVVELVKAGGKVKETTLLVNDGGRKTDAANAERSARRRPSRAGDRSVLYRRGQCRSAQTTFMPWW